MSQSENLFGFHAVESRLRSDPASILEVWMDANRKDPRAARLLNEFERLGVNCQLVDKQRLAKRVGKGNHQGVVANVRPMPKLKETALYELIEGLDHPPFLLILDQVTDPHNLGACLRSANGAGIDAVILPKDGACAVTDTVTRIASGATESTPVFYVSNLVRTIKALQDQRIWVTGCADEADAPLFKSDLTGSTAIVLGAEGKGLRRLTRENCDQIVSIPMVGTVSSLNVSVATGVVLYEAFRQRALRC